VAKILLKCIRGYHSNLWPHARPGERRWVDGDFITRMNRDGGMPCFEVVEVQDGEAVREPEVPAEAKAEAKEAPKKKRGRPKKIKE